MPAANSEKNKTYTKGGIGNFQKGILQRVAKMSNCPIQHFHALREFLQLDEFWLPLEPSTFTECLVWEVAKGSLN